jgi:hypothetical protein
MIYDIKQIPSELSGILDNPSLLLHVSFDTEHLFQQTLYSWIGTFFFSKKYYI